MDASSSVLHTPVLSETQSFDEYSAPSNPGNAMGNGGGQVLIHSKNSNDESVSAQLISADVNAEVSTIQMTNENEHCASRKHSHHTFVEICSLQGAITQNGIE